MNDEIRLHCPDCGHDMALPPQRCPHCSQLMTARRPAGGRSSLSPIIVVLLLFLLLGPFGFGLLWRSDRFSFSWKIALTLIVSIYTVAIIWYAVDAVDSAMSSPELDKALQQLQGM